MDSFIVQVVANNDGKIVAIAFEKGECLPVNDVTVTNAKAGVKITWSDSENAFYYDIYKSVDGKKYEKIARISYNDKDYAFRSAIAEAGINDVLDKKYIADLASELSEYAESLG